MKPHKAAGPDGIPTRILNLAASPSTRSLDISAHNNFGSCLFRPTGIIMYNWCLSIIGIIRSAYL